MCHSSNDKRSELGYITCQMRNIQLSALEPKVCHQSMKEWLGIGLIIWFNGILNIVGYLMPNTVIYKKVKLATIVEGDPKAPFSIAYYTKV